jgi:hypothetical protein
MSAACILSVFRELPLYIGSRSVKPYERTTGCPPNGACEFQNGKFTQPLGRRAAGSEGELIHADRLTPGKHHI